MNQNTNKSIVRLQWIGYPHYDGNATEVSILSVPIFRNVKGALNESSKLETAVRPLES